MIPEGALPGDTMRRRFGIPLTAALLLLTVIVRPYWPLDSVEPYYVLAGLSTLWAVIDSIKLQVSKHGSSQLLSPVALAAWMLIAWPLAFPWYLKVHYLVSNGESADKVGSFAAIRLAFMGIFVVGVGLFVGGAAMIGRYLPGVRDYIATSLLVARDMSRQFGGSARLELSANRDLVVTMDQPRPDDTLANQRFARQVARYARTHFPGADSLKSIEVVLHEAGTAPNRGHYKWTVAELSGAPAKPVDPSAAAVHVASAAAPSVPSRRGAGVPRNGSVAQAGAPVTPTRASAAQPVGAPPAAAKHAFARLIAADPTVRWVSDSALVADIDCDGVADTVALGRKRAEVHVGFASSVDPVPQILVFVVGRNVKDAVCSARAAISIESLDWEPADRGLQRLEGFQRSPTCKGVGLGDGDCRSVHIFWSRSTKHVEWFQG